MWVPRWKAVWVSKEGNTRVDSWWRISVRSVGAGGRGGRVGVSVVVVVVVVEGMRGGIGVVVDGRGIGVVIFFGWLIV